MIKTSIRAGGLSALALLATWVSPAAAAPARPAADNPNVQAATANYQAWSLRCETRADPKPALKICGLMSSVSVKGEEGKPAVATVVMLRSLPDSDRFQFSMNLPISVWLPTGVVLQNAAGKEMLSLPFVACHSDTCEAGMVVTPDQVAALNRAGDQATALYQLQTRKAVKLSFSMKGFSEGFAALGQQLSKR